MWMVEAKTFGKNSQSFRYGPTDFSQAQRLRNELSNAGEWAQVRAWNVVSEAERVEGDFQ